MGTNHVVKDLDDILGYKIDEQEVLVVRVREVVTRSQETILVISQVSHLHHHPIEMGALSPQIIIRDSHFQGISLAIDEKIENLGAVVSVPSALMSVVEVLGSTNLQVLELCCRRQCSKIATQRLRT